MTGGRPQQARGALGLAQVPQGLRLAQPFAQRPAHPQRPLKKSQRPGLSQGQVSLPQIGQGVSFAAQSPTAKICRACQRQDRLLSPPLARNTSPRLFRATPSPYWWPSCR